MPDEACVMPSSAESPTADAARSVGGLWSRAHSVSDTAASATSDVMDDRGCDAPSVGRPGPRPVGRHERVRTFVVHLSPDAADVERTMPGSEPGEARAAVRSRLVHRDSASGCPP
eukprot:CAMPEP_0185188158 /NCGR_PEP_ID=MMETSP1140-20130426/5235_1 /TAXON_ID=298111 /ORGANISM="Pavlova sp., Strain CCMP459" /LENGTH=114 /DNA_ID=CAMNT_0027754643 /DNA_START=53 /DNA_END=392 /DNA_ORIENTATION=-